MGTTISGTNPAGVTLTSAGDNPTTIAADAQLYGGLYVSYPGAWQVLNLGTVEGPDVGISLSSGGSIDNAALVSAAVAGVFVAGQTGTVVNSGAILSAGRAVYLGAGGSVTNQGGGTIAGTVGIGIGHDSATVVNAGTIMGTGAGDAVRFATFYANRMVVDPGAVFLGTVDGGNTIGASALSMLELAAYTTAGTLSGLGTQFVNFAQVTVDLGAQWVLDPTDTVAAGVTLANAGTLTGPVTLAAGAELSNAATGTVTAAGLAAVYAGTGDAATVVNAGIILSTGLYAAVALGAGGTVINQAGATITGYYGIGGGPGGALTVVNGGSILGTESGIGFAVAGILTNQSTGLITGTSAITGAPGYGVTVLNAGSIIATGGVAITLSGYGSVTNQSGGVITGYDGVHGTGNPLTVVNAGTILGDPTSNASDGIWITDGGMVSNQTTGLISGGDGVYAGSAPLTVVNAGTIIATGSISPTHTAGFGIYLAGGGSVTNQSGGTISGYQGGIYGGLTDPVTVVNDGTIAGTGSTSLGVYLAGGGSLTNQSGGTISGYQGGIYGGVTSPITVVNDGTIAGTGSAGLGVYLAGGGSVTNQSGGPISGYWDGIYGGAADPITVVNDGTIAGTGSASLGVYLAGGGTVTNQGSGTISGYGAGIVASRGALTVVNAGTIAATGARAESVVLVAGGSVSNQETGLITGGVGVLGAPSGAVTLQNAGSILANEIGAYLSGGGYVTNQAGGVIGGYIGIAGYDLTVVNAGTITSDATSSSGTGIDAGPNTWITNQAGGTISGYTGIYGYGLLTVENTGIITGNATSSHGTGILVYGSLSATNLAGGTISGYNGVLSAHNAADGDGPLTLVNAGTITANETSGLGVGFLGGGSVTNQNGGVIIGATGIEADGAAAYVVNGGTIIATGSVSATRTAGVGVGLFAGGSVTNQNGGTIAGPDAIYGGPTGPITVVNGGIVAAAGSASFGVYLAAGGTVTNQGGGTISGYQGITTFNDGATIENAGAIIGTQHAIRFGTYTNRLIVDPGASFGGVVDGGNTIGAAAVSTLELASAATAGTLSGIGTQFIDFAQTTIDAGAAWTLTGGNSLAIGTTLENAGTLTVLSAGFYDGGLVVNDGSIAIGPAGATLTDLTGAGDLSLAAGTTLDVLGTVSAGETIAFASGSGMLDVDPAGFAGQIDDFTVGDTIGLSSVTDAVSAGIVNANTLEIQRSLSPAIDLILDPTQDYSGNLYSVTADGAVTENAFCFLRDTLIRSDRGEVKVQDLVVGDRVVTLSGAVRPIIWIGSGEALVRPGRRSAATPVIVRRNAVADGVPWYDLRVTKGHALFIDGVLIPVEFLINHRSIHWDDHQAAVTFYHIELETHDVLIANGMPAESYRDDGNRWLFRNANTGWDQLPKPPCAPVLTDGPIVDAIWQRLRDRTPGPVEIALTEYPDLHLLVDGVRVNASARFGTPHVFRLESRPHQVRVVSHAGAPAELGFARDPRRLGVAIAQIMVSKGRRLQVMEATDPALTDGFHPSEPSLGLRWTDGDATLPTSLFEGFDGPMLLVLRLGGSTLYRAFGQASVHGAAQQAGPLAA